MRRITITLNLIVAAFFACFVAYTFVARQHLDGVARGFVTERTLHYSRPIVELAGESLNVPLVQKLLTDEEKAAIRQELVQYGNDPSTYIGDLTREKMLPPNRRNPNPLLDKVVSIKERIRSFYDRTLVALISDLRIFSVSNLCAATLATALAFWSRKDIQKSVVWLSLLMLVAVLYSSYLYVDGLTFFRILFQTHMGWWYPIFLCVVLAGLYLDCGGLERTSEQTSQLKAEQANAT